MATPLACHSDGEHSISIEEPTADGNAAAGSTAPGESQQKESAASSSPAGESQQKEGAAGSPAAAAGELQRTESSADDKAMWKKLKSLHNFVFFIESLEYLGNAIGTVAFLWATVVLLGGFCSLLTRLDFWFATIMVFVEGTRVFISKDASVNQWLFGSTRAFRWDHFCFPKESDIVSSFIAVLIGVGVSLAPIEVGSQMITGILKVALLALTCLLLARRPWGRFAIAVLLLLGLASFCGIVYALGKMGRNNPHLLADLKSPKNVGLFYLWIFGTLIGTIVTCFIFPCIVCCGVPVLGLKAIVALALVLLPLLKAKLGSKHMYYSISIAVALMAVNAIEVEDNRSSSSQAPLAEQNNSSSSPEAPPEEEQINALLLGRWQFLLKIVDTIMPILFFWGVMFPLPGIPLKEAFGMLFSVIAAVLVGNLQIPVAFLQILLSYLRLRSLLGGHHSHRDYHPLPDGASPNLVPSIVVFFVLELCQGLSNILGVFLGLLSFHCRKSLLRVSGLKKDEWGAKAVNLYYHQAFMTIKEKGLFPMEKSTPPSFHSFAIESLGSTSSEMQIVRLHVLDYYLQHGDSKCKRKLMAQFAKDAAGIVTKITGTISHLITDEEILRSDNDDKDTGTDTDTDTSFLTFLKRLLKLKQKQEHKQKQKQKQIHSSLSQSVNLVWRLAVAGGKIGTSFRQELSANPILLHSLQRILDMEDCPQDLLEQAMDVMKWLALHAAEATTKDTGVVIPKLMGVFLNRRDGRSLRKAAGEELANLTITSSGNCKNILDLDASPAARRDLIKNLISMLKDDEYISVTTTLLHNLYAYSRDCRINLDLDNDAKEGLKSALRRVFMIIRVNQNYRFIVTRLLRIIMGNKNDIQQLENSGIKVDKQLDAALRIASQIGYVIPKEDFALVLAENLAPNANAAAERLVGKLVDTLKSNREPNREFPRLRRVLIETVISIVEACPVYIDIFRKEGAEEALNMLKGTSSIHENYKVFVEGEGMNMVPESPPMDKLVDQAKGLIMVGGKSNQASDCGS